MKVLVIGSGGREHALCHSFAASSRIEKIFCASGNAGISADAECVAIAPDNLDALAAFALQNGVDLTFVGGETTLALGIVDKFDGVGLPIVGPTRAAAQLESSKTFAKQFMERHGVPTARFFAAGSSAQALAALKDGRMGDHSAPVVVKADGLAAGKGVVVAQNRTDGLAAVRELDGIGNEASNKIVLEECLVGKEVSLLMFVDGEDFVLMPPARDHKRVGDGDTGANTGGMGTITDTALLSPGELEEVVSTMIRPTLMGCVADGYAFRGVLFLGLMMTADGPKLLEYNVRFGDPEAQAILVRLGTDLTDICDAMLGGRLGATSIDWRPGSSACVVMASAGYPSTPRTGDFIHGLAEAAALPNIEIFHGATKSSDDLPGVVTSGGRVLGVTARADDLDSALDRAYAAVDLIKFDGQHFRTDIGRT